MSVLLVTGIEGALNCAEHVKVQLGMEVDLAEGKKSALAALRQKEFAAVVVDETLAECDPAAADAIWERAGLAIPLQINFALFGAARLIREIRAALRRREREQALARRAAADDMGFAVKDTVEATRRRRSREPPSSPTGRTIDIAAFTAGIRALSAISALHAP